MGGLDIFRAKKEGDNKWGTPENLKFPMNSPQHDYGIIFDEMEGIKDRGFFSSNRNGSKGRDDIWSFVLPPVLFDLTIEVWPPGANRYVLIYIIECKSSAYPNIFSEPQGF